MLIKVVHIHSDVAAAELTASDIRPIQLFEFIQPSACAREMSHHDMLRLDITNRSDRKARFLNSFFLNDHNTVTPYDRTQADAPISQINRLIPI